MMPPVGQDGMLLSIGSANAKIPRGQIGHRKAIRVIPIRGKGTDPEGRGVEGRMP
jgi:hypothetical protein